MEKSRYMFIFVAVGNSEILIPVPLADKCVYVCKKMKYILFENKNSVWCRVHSFVCCLSFRKICCTGIQFCVSLLDKVFTQVSQILNNTDESEPSSPDMPDQCNICQTVNSCLLWSWRDIWHLWVMTWKVWRYLAQSESPIVSHILLLFCKSLLLYSNFINQVCISSA